MSDAREFRLDQLPAVREALAKEVPDESSDPRSYEEFRQEPGWIMSAAVNGGEKPDGPDFAADLGDYIPFSRRMRIQAWEAVRRHVAEMKDEPLHQGDREDAEAMIAALDKLMADLKAPRPWPPEEKRG